MLSEFQNRENRMKYTLKVPGGYYWFGINNARLTGQAERLTGPRLMRHPLKCIRVASVVMATRNGLQSGP
ncbi:hypothetical protein [Spirosoma telluris]